MEYKIIKQRKKKPADPAYISALADKYSLSLLSATYLAAKDFASYDEIEKFLSPSMNDLSDFSVFPQMTAAASRIKKAIAGSERILIYGDYDCDGVCAAFIILKALRSKGADVGFYLPDRFTDGYGLSPLTARKIAELAPSLVITVDNGITARAEIAMLTEKGIDVIITDHHNPPDVLPAAITIDPKCEADDFISRDICGAAVALRLAESLDIARALQKELAVFAGIATIADIVPLKGENRVYADYAAANIKTTGNVGLNALIKACDLNNKAVSAADVSFVLAPRINAAGRMKSAAAAMSLFLSEDTDTADRLAAELDELNTTRRGIEDGLFEAACLYIKENDLTGTELVLFVNIPDAHEGVIGIVAGRLTEAYNRPAVVCSVHEGIAKGSARSLAGFDIYTALKSAGDLYIKFGGHEQAAGFLLPEADMGRLADTVNSYAHHTDLPSLVYRRFYYDAEISPGLLTAESAAETARFAPFGVGNPKPVFLLSGIDVRDVKTMGADGRHVRFAAVKNGGRCGAVAFNMSDEFSGIDAEKKYDIVFSAGINTFRGASELQLEVKAIDEHTQCPEAYYISLYDHFYANPAGCADFTPPPDKLLHLSPESVLNESERLFVVYGRDAFLRALKYAAAVGAPVKAAYGSFDGFAPGRINILVNPVDGGFTDIAREITVLDRPCFCGYESRFYERCERAVFLKCTPYSPELYIDRDYVAFIYKKIPLLQNIGGDLAKFCDYLNSLSSMPVNYFSLRICFDILRDTDIIDYVIKDGKISVSFKKISGPVNINRAAVMLRIRDAYM